MADGIEKVMMNLLAKGRKAMRDRGAAHMTLDCQTVRRRVTSVRIQQSRHRLMLE